MFFLKSIPANIRYYLRQSVFIYVVDCLFLGAALVLLGLINLEHHNLTQLKTQLDKLTAAEQLHADNPLQHLLTTNQTLLTRYQVVYYGLLVAGIIGTSLLTWFILNRRQRDIETFVSANWPQLKIMSYYTLTAVCLFVLAGLTVILGILLFNAQFWQGLEMINQRWLQKPLKPMLRPEAFQPLFKDHLTDFSSHSLLNPILHERTKQGLTNQVLQQLWQPFLSLVVPVMLSSQLRLIRFRKN